MLILNAFLKGASQNDDTVSDNNHSSLLSRWPSDFIKNHDPLYYF